MLSRSIDHFVLPRSHFPSASHVVLLLVKKYPQYRIVNYDKVRCCRWRELTASSLQLDYCSSLLNLREIEGRPNYVFVRGDIQSADLVNRAYIFPLSLTCST